MFAILSDPRPAALIIVRQRIVVVGAVEIGTAPVEERGLAMSTRNVPSASFSIPVTE